LLCFECPREFREKCLAIFAEGIKSTDLQTVQVSYNSMCSFYSQRFPVDFDTVAGHLSRPEISNFALTFLVRLRNVPPNAALLRALFAVAVKEGKAILVPIQVARSAEGAEALLLNDRWLLQKLPTLEHTLRLF
jgi:hypothetical protein